MLSPLTPATRVQVFIIYLLAVLRIRIHLFLGLPDPDPLVRGMDSDPYPSIIMQK